MVILQRDGLRIEAAAVAEGDGSCCVTAEVFEGVRMIRGYYRRMDIPPEAYRQAEREVAEELACMTGEAE
jgi:hypothetical protein